MSNRCQGLPDGPCPDERCDASVKYGIHDLFLCKSCADTHDTRDTLQDTVSKEVAMGKTKPPKKSTKSKDLTSATQGETSGTRTRGAKLNTNSNTKSILMITTAVLIVKMCARAAFYRYIRRSDDSSVTYACKPTTKNVL